MNDQEQVVSVETKKKAKELLIKEATEKFGDDTQHYSNIRGLVTEKYEEDPKWAIGELTHLDRFVDFTNPDALARQGDEGIGEVSYSWRQHEKMDVDATLLAAALSCAKDYLQSSAVTKDEHLSNLPSNKKLLFQYLLSCRLDQFNMSVAHESWANNLLDTLKSSLRFSRRSFTIDIFERIFDEKGHLSPFISKDDKVVLDLLSFALHNDQVAKILISFLPSVEPVMRNSFRETNMDTIRNRAGFKHLEERKTSIPREILLKHLISKEQP